MKKTFLITTREGEELNDKVTHYEDLPDHFRVHTIDLDIENGEGIGDEYHTMHELYQHRMALNIALFHAWKKDYVVYKTKLHADGTMFAGYFVVVAETPEGQISYHYKLKHWDKFNLSELEKAERFDGHTSDDVLQRLGRL